MGTVQSVFLGLFVFVFYKEITNFYTNLSELRALIYPVMKFFALYTLTDGYKAVICGVMRGLSK